MKDQERSSALYFTLVSTLEDIGKAASIDTFRKRCLAARELVQSGQEIVLDDWHVALRVFGHTRAANYCGNAQAALQHSGLTALQARVDAMSAAVIGCEDEVCIVSNTVFIKGIHNGAEAVVEFFNHCGVQGIILSYAWLAVFCNRLRQGGMFHMY